MNSNIFEYPPVERKYVAVRRFIQAIGGENMFNRLLKRLNLTRKEFTDLYGEKLIGDPAMFNHEVVEMMCEDIRRVRHND